MLINVVVRTYAWRGDPGERRERRAELALAHFGSARVQLLYTEWAIIIGSVHYSCR